MEYHVAIPLLQTLEAAAQTREATAHPADSTALAWHLRQRDAQAARAHAAHAAAHMDREGSTQRQQALRYRLALTHTELAALTGELVAAEGWLAQAQSLGCPPLEAADLHWAEAILAKAAGQRTRELQAYAQALAAARQATDPYRLALAKAWLHYEGSFSQPDQPEAKAPRQGVQHPGVDALLSAAKAMQLSRRDPGQASRLFLRASEQAQRVGLVRHAVVCTLNAGSALQGLGDLVGAAACLDIGESVARSTGWPALLGVVQTKMGAYLAAQGRLAPAAELLCSAVAALAVTPGSINRANACSELALTLLRLGRAVDAVEPMASAIEVYRQVQSSDNLALNLIHQSKILVLLNQVQPALAALHEAEDLISTHGLSALRVGVHEALATLHRRHALPDGTGTRSGGDMNSSSLSAPTWALHHAEATLREGKSLTGWQPPTALLVDTADDWQAAGHAQRAYELARQAVSQLQASAALAAQPQVEPFPLRRAQASPVLDPEGLWHPAEPSGDERRGAAQLLTPKEIEVLSLVARNYSNKEIALTLAVGAETVKWHLKKVFSKLAVASRRRAVAKARTLGLVGYDSH